ncbi:hypothetical protein M9H77_14900 [Catharanthus roseus]|uniref:Uncharacterized protein n=1 Tax=Catharanthus roseus TaxID=4058 RepID=A0ACC0BPD1_CATRO|nr:hypothetical protein M9H77_14900 [Catharanthus roseus]
MTRNQISVKVNVQRKVLADVSNIRGSFAKPSSQDKSKSLKLAADTWSASSSSSKPLTANARTNLTGATGGQKTSKNACPSSYSMRLSPISAACKDVKATSNDLRSETQGRKLVSSAISRTSGSKHLPPTRTSLPVSRQVNKANPDIKEESTERLEGSRGKFGFPVKPKVSRSVASQISYTRNHHWKTRAVFDCDMKFDSGSSVPVLQYA